MCKIFDFSVCAIKNNVIHKSNTHVYVVGRIEKITKLVLQVTFIISGYTDWRRIYLWSEKLSKNINVADNARFFRHEVSSSDRTVH